MQGHSSRRVHLDLGPLFAVCIMATLPASVRVSVRVVGSDFIPGPKARLRKDLSKGQSWRMAGTSVAVTATACCSVGLRARKPTAEMLKNKVAKGMQRREMQMDAPDAIEEFQGLKDDPLASWSLLGDQEFLARILTVLFLAFLPCAYLTSKVYPVSNEIGELLPQNILADVSFGFSVAALFLTAVLLRIGYRQLEVNQLLRQRSIFLETGGGGYFVQKKSAANQRGLILLNDFFRFVAFLYPFVSWKFKPLFGSISRKPSKSSWRCMPLSYIHNMTYVVQT